MFKWSKERDIEEMLKTLDLKTRSNKAEIGKLRQRIKDLEAQTIPEDDDMDDVSDIEEVVEDKPSFGRRVVG